MRNFKSDENTSFQMQTDIEKGMWDLQVGVVMDAEGSKDASLGGVGWPRCAAMLLVVDSTGDVASLARCVCI
jgi:hypothetical protein